MYVYIYIYTYIYIYIYNASVKLAGKEGILSHVPVPELRHLEVRDPLDTNFHQH